LPNIDYPLISDWLDEKIPDYMKQAKLPGFSIAVIKEGKTLCSHGFGARDPRKNLPATPDTLYCIGSITKSFVAIGIMKLMEKGLFSLSDPVNEHIPFKLGNKNKPIKIFHLLTHSLGLPSLATSSIALHRGVGEDSGIPLGSKHDFYRLVNGAQNEIVASPGNRFFYHNAAWRMLGNIIQEKSGAPFHKFIKDEILNPLGMSRSTLNIDEFYADPDHIVPHWKKPDGTVEPSRFPYPNPEDNLDFSFISAAGGIISSVNEMTRYLNAQIEKGAFPGSQLISKESFKEMQTLHIQRPDGYYGEYGYGYGLSITPDFLGYKMVSHSGSILVSTAYMAFLPELKMGAVMMGNSAKLPYEEIAESVFALLMGKDPSKVIPSLMVKRRINQLIGHYEIYRGIESVNVLKVSGMLYLQSKTPFVDVHQPLIPEDSSLESTKFYTLVDGVKTPIEFVLRKDGGVDLFVERYCYHKSSSVISS
jgi:CubicO group peptidase (beta-lactamase class C family)